MNLKTSYALAGTVKKHSAAAGGFEISRLTDNRNGRLYLVVKRKSWRTSNRKTLMGKLLKRKHSIQGQPRLSIDHVIIISFSVAQIVERLTLNREVVGSSPIRKLIKL